MAEPVIQIVPRLPPPASGVGDYALNMARRMRAAMNVETVFVCGTRAIRTDHEFPIQGTTSQSAAGLAEALERACRAANTAGIRLLLQLSAYGYHKYATPFWLLEGLRRWLSSDRRRTLVTMFHELHASGPFWSRTYWAAPFQKRVLRGILELSTACMTSVPQFARQLRAWSRDSKRVEILPIPSGIGEPMEVPAIAVRSRRMCIFGLRPGGNLSAAAVMALGRIASAWELREIAIVGEEPLGNALRGMRCPVVEYKGASPSQASDILRDSVLGVSWYPPQYLGKSSAFGAYCAHGVPTLPLGDASSDTEADIGITAGVHYLRLEDLPKTWQPKALQSVADAIRDWYPGHDVGIHTSIAAELLRAGVPRA